jgi:predicted kinase
MVKRLVIMRGVAGSGKSTRANEIYNEAKSNGLTALMCSADNYFMVQLEDDPAKGWEYRYDGNKIADAHRDCRKRAVRAITDGVDVVIVDNTNTTIKEVYPYVEAGVVFDYNVEFTEPQTPWWHSVKPLLKGKKAEARLRSSAKIFADRNTHGVPEHNIFKMLMRWEPDMTVETVLGQDHAK